MNKDVLGQALGVLNPHHIIGSLFRFESPQERGVPKIELVGTIVAYEIHKGRSLVLTVSNKTFNIHNLLKITYFDTKWEACYDFCGRTEYCEGTLKLLK